jgi:peptide/nickel transport system substrate-binding protein
VAGNFDMTFPYELTAPLVADVKSQMPNVVCDISPMNVAANILMNPVPPFDNLDVRRAVAMALDRKSFVDILTQGKGDIGTAMQPPEGALGNARGDAPGVAGLRSRGTLWHLK